MRKLMFIIPFCLTTLYSCAQTVFDATATFKAGFNFSVNGTVYKEADLLKTTMVYPSAGIPLSLGNGWSVSVANNSDNWNKAYGWGNHAGLYRPITWVPLWTEIANKPTLFSGSYNDLTDKLPEISLTDGMAYMKYLKIPSKTTNEIKAISFSADSVYLIWDKTTKSLNVWDGTTLRTFITNK